MSKIRTPRWLSQIAAPGTDGNDLECKTVFLGGPRQVGKTTLSKEVSKDFFLVAVGGQINKRSSPCDSAFKPPKKLGLPMVIHEVHKIWVYKKKGESPELIWVKDSSLVLACNQLRRGGN